MSDQNTGPRGAANAPSEEEIREYVQQLRSAPVDQILSEIIFGLLNAAQAKLGRRDGRLLIDAATVLTEHVRAHVPAEFTGQIDQIVRQLQLGHIQAEGQVAASGEPEPNDLEQEPASPGGSSTTTRTPPAQTPPTSTSTSSRLLIPGRDF